MFADIVRQFNLIKTVVMINHCPTWTTCQCLCPSKVLSPWGMEESVFGGWCVSMELWVCVGSPQVRYSLSSPWSSTCSWLLCSKKKRLSLLKCNYCYVLYLSTHCARVDCECTLYEVKLQDASLQKRRVMRLYLFVLGQQLVNLISLTFDWENP